MKIDDRPTPQTDARVTVCAECGPMMDVDFARRLERERDVLREALKPFAELAICADAVKHWQLVVRSTNLKGERDIVLTAQQALLARATLAALEK